MSQPRLIRRIAEHMVGLAVGAAIIGFVEHRYRAHEQGLAALPVLDPWGIKYAYRTQLERSTPHRLVIARLWRVCWLRSSACWTRERVYVLA